MSIGSVGSLRCRITVRGSPISWWMAVEFLGVRGATVNTFLTTDMFARILAARPDCVFLCLGDNSLDRPKGNTTMTLLVRT